MLITDDINRSQLYTQLAQKYAELNKIDSQSRVSPIKEAFNVEMSKNGTPKNYDEEDYQRVLDKLKQRDNEVKNHEQAHSSSGQPTTPISYNYQTGPDGKLYAVGGQVRLNVSIPNDPNEALYKLNQIQSAATSPSEGLSSADLGIAQAANMNKLLILSKIEENAQEIEKSSLNSNQSSNDIDLYSNSNNINNQQKNDDNEKNKDSQLLAI